MKTIIALLTTTMLVAGAATTAMAAPTQGSDEAAGYALSLQAARGFDGAFASARVPHGVRNSTINLPAQGDFQLQGR